MSTLTNKDFIARLVFTDDEFIRVATRLRKLAKTVETRTLTDGRFTAKFMGSVDEAINAEGTRTPKRTNAKRTH